LSGHLVGELGSSRCWDW